VSNQVVFKNARVCLLLFSFLSFINVSLCFSQDDVSQEGLLREAYSEESNDHDGEVSDPLETVNRGIFAFNDTVDVYFLEPIAKGYDYVTPQVIQSGVKNFFENLNYPKYLLSDLIQFKFRQVAAHTGRFLINTTVGVAGLIDVAQEVGLKRNYEDTAVGLASHGIPNGPYLVIPFLGPSTLRDTVGTVVDGFINPLNLLFYSSMEPSVVVPLSLSLQGLNIVQTRTGLLDAIKAAKESSLDYYTFAQSSYIQYRQGLLTGSENGDSSDSSPSAPTGKSFPLEER
jgi:phospholipid-binding lipoprotein MlaA